MRVDASGEFRLTASRTWYSMSLFIAIVGGLILVRPGFAFKEDGTLYEFGIGPDRSVFSFGVLTSMAAVVSGFAFSLRDMWRAGDTSVAGKLPPNA